MTFRLSHLAILLALVIVATVGGGVAWTWLSAEDEFRDLMEDELESQAELLAELVTSDGFELSRADLLAVLDEVFDADEEDAFWVTIYDRERGTQLSNLEHDLPPADEGDVELDFGGYGWHGISIEEDDTVVQLLRRNDLYARLQEETGETIVTPVLIGGGLTLLLLAALLLLTLLPVTRLARQLEARTPDSLVPVTVRTPIREFRVLRDSVNRLLSDVDEVLRRERGFASDVAHELRTPLSTLTIELASDDPDFDSLRAETHRLSRVVDQLLTLTRLAQHQWQGRMQPVALDELCKRVAVRLEPKFTEAGQALETRLAAVRVLGDATLLEVLVNNLLHNVPVHCPAGVRASLAIFEADGAVRLDVRDDGPGVAGSLLDGMNRGATRLDSKSEGLGLGLAICARIAAVHGASIRYDRNSRAGSGLQVTVTFPGE